MSTKIQYRIKFRTDILLTDEKRGGNESLKSEGDVEKLILRGIMNTYGAQCAKDVEHFSLAADLIDMIKHSDAELIIDAEDKAMIEEGFKGCLKAGRPVGWIEYQELFRQLRNPETIETK